MHIINIVLVILNLIFNYCWTFQSTNKANEIISTEIFWNASMWQQSIRRWHYSPLFMSDKELFLLLKNTWTIVVAMIEFYVSCLQRKWASSMTVKWNRRIEKCFGLAVVSKSSRKKEKKSITTRPISAFFPLARQGFSSPWRFVVFLSFCFSVALFSFFDRC